jgi:hypothetical protein
MIKNSVRWLIYNKTLAVLILFLLFATAALVWWQYSDLVDEKGASLPLDQTPQQGQNGSMTTNTQISSSGESPAGGVFTIQLSEGQAQAQQPTPVPVAGGEPLTQAEIDAVTARLPSLPEQPDDEVDFNLAGDPIPPPRPGSTIEQPFPPQAAPQGSTAVEEGPLQVLRFSPEGEIPVAPFINITFNQPMVALGTLGDLAMAEVPVRIEPALPGTWRWLGTRTLNFQYDSELIDRLQRRPSTR